MADTIEPEVLVNSILGKISDVLLNGDGEVVPKSDDHFLAFMSPGIPMLASDFDYAAEGFGGVYRRNADPEDLEGSTGPQEGGAADGPSVEQQLAADALQKYMRAESFFNIVDLVPDTSGIVDSGRINTWNPEARISRVYAMALQQSQVYDNPPDEETREKVDRWRSKLVTTRTEKDIVTDEEVEITEESELIKRYNQKMLDYLAAAMEYNNTRISAIGGNDPEAVHRMAVNGPLLQMKVRAAMNDWSTNGHKGDYEKLSAAIQSVEDRAFVLLKQRYKEDYFRSLLTNPSSGSNFLYSAPASAAFANAASGWMGFKFRSNDIASNYKFNARSTKAAGGFHIGTVGIGGRGKIDKKKWQGQVDRKNFSMEFSMARVPISRPWLNLDYILSGFWRFDQNNEIHKNSMISDGGDPPDGLMPAVTTDCIFVKDLKLHFGESHSDFMRQQQSISGGGFGTFGPLHMGGAHSATDAERQFEADWNSENIEVLGLQLIGFVCYLLPKAPNPNPRIENWI